MTDLPESQRLIFRRWSDVDPDLASLLWRDPEVMHFLGGPYSEEQVRKRLHVEIENDRLFGFQYWPIFVRDDGTFAGVCGLKPYKRSGFICGRSSGVSAMRRKGHAP